MKTPFRPAAQSALTLVELLVIITLVAIVTLYLRPFDHRAQTMGWETHALSNAKQIAVALRLYAADHDGKFPSFTLHNGKPGTTQVSDSNTAFAQLFPAYINYEAIFWVPKSAFCSPAPPDEVIDITPLDTLKSGENEWAYIPGLTGKSNPSLPMLADGFASITAHTYASSPAKKGGIWKGQKAIIVHVDGSGVVMHVDQRTMTVLGPNGAPGMTGDIFTTANSASGWLQPANAVVNPK